MDELTPIYHEQGSIFEDEMSMSLFSPTSPNRILFLLIPIGLLFLSRTRDNNIFSQPPSPSHRTNTYKAIPSPLMSFDSDMLDKMKLMLDGLKKARSIQELRKNMVRSGGQPGKMNFDVMKELLEVMGSSSGDNNKSQIHNVANMMSMFEKVRDVKKIMDVQKAVKSESDGDTSSQINNIIDMITPMLPEEHVKNIESFKKMAQMMKFMNMFEGSNDDSNDEDTGEDE